MSKWLLIASGSMAIGAAVAVLTGRIHENVQADRRVAALLGSTSRPVSGSADVDSFSMLPPPVVRYFRHVLTDGQQLIKTAKL